MLFDNNIVANLRIALERAIPEIAQRNRDMLEEMRKAKEPHDKQFLALLDSATDFIRRGN